MEFYPLMKYEDIAFSTKKKKIVIFFFNISSSNWYVDGWVHAHPLLLSICPAKGTMSCSQTKNYSHGHPK